MLFLIELSSAVCHEGNYVPWLRTNIRLKWFALLVFAKALPPLPMQKNGAELEDACGNSNLLRNKRIIAIMDFWCHWKHSSAQPPARLLWCSSAKHCAVSPWLQTTQRNSSGGLMVAANLLCFLSRTRGLSLNLNVLHDPWKLMRMMRGLTPHILSPGFGRYAWGRCLLFETSLAVQCLDWVSLAWRMKTCWQFPSLPFCV